MTSPITVHIDTPGITIYLTSPDPGDAINRALAPILERIDTMATAQEDFSRELQETKDAVGAAVPAMNAAADSAKQVLSASSVSYDNVAGTGPAKISIGETVIAVPEATAPQREPASGVADAPMSWVSVCG